MPNINKVTSDTAMSDTQKNQSPKIKFLISGGISGVFLTIIIALGIYFLWPSILKNREPGNSNQNTANLLSGKPGEIKKQDQSSSILPASDTENSLLDELPKSSAWEVDPQKEITTKELSENNLIYAIKKDYTVSVYKKNLSNLSRTKIYEFEEDAQAVMSGNSWEESSPSIALSPNGKNIAFADREGLKVYNLETSVIKSLIKKIEEPPKEGLPPRWSDPALNSSSEDSVDGTYNLVTPGWSSDGKYINVSGAGWEGSRIFIVDFQSGKVSPAFAFDSSTMVWSPNNDSLINMGQGVYSGAGLYVILENNFEDGNNIAKAFNKENGGFYEVNFSPDGKKIVFAFSDNAEDSASPKTSLATANIDGTEFNIIVSADKVFEEVSGDQTERRSKPMSPIFSLDGNSILFVKIPFLIKYDLATKKSEQLAILPNEFYSWNDLGWTQEGFLKITGRYDLFDGKKLYILDLKNNKIVYESPIFSYFTTFAGFTN